MIATRSKVRCQATSRRLSAAARGWAAVSLALTLLNSLSAASGSEVEKWSDWKFLLGTWVAVDSNGVPGKASEGGTSFTIDLQGAVLVRKNHAAYPAAKDRPAATHDDLMIFHRVGDSVRAEYFDSEGHQISYVATFEAASNIWTLVSEIKVGTPRYRFTYARNSLQDLKVKFEIAPPNSPEDFKTYVDGMLRRQQ